MRRCRGSTRRAPTRACATGCEELEPRSAASGRRRARHRRGAEVPGGVHGGGLAAGRQGARGKRAHPVSRTWRCSPRSSGTGAASACWPASRTTGSSRSPRPVHRRVLAERQDDRLHRCDRARCRRRCSGRRCARRCARARASRGSAASRRARATTGLIARVNAARSRPRRRRPCRPTCRPARRSRAPSAVGPSSSGSLPDWLRRLLQRLPAWHWWLLIASIVLALLCLLVPVVGIVLAVLVVVGGVALRLLARRSARADRLGRGGPASVVDDETRTPAAVDELPTSSSFALPPTVDARPERLPAPPPAVPGPDTGTAPPLQGGAAQRRTRSTSTERGDSRARARTARPGGDPRVRVRAASTRSQRFRSTLARGSRSRAGSPTS